MNLDKHSRVARGSSMTNGPFFSVCIPTFQYADLLPEAIDSVLAQTFTDFELLILDDASTDNTDSIVEKYRDERVFYFKSRENRGIFASLNELCERATGRYIKILCADDVLSKWCLETIHRLLAQSDFHHKLVAVKETPYRWNIETFPLICAEENFELNSKNLFRFLMKKDSWGGGLAELCVEKNFFSSCDYFGSADKENDFSKDIITWLNMILKVDTLMIGLPLVFQRPHAGQARYKLGRITQLKEMLEFFYEGETRMCGHPDFYLSRRRVLDSYVLSHYWYGVKSFFAGQGTAYLRQVKELTRAYGYVGFPWRSLSLKLKQRLFSQPSLDRI